MRLRKITGSIILNVVSGPSAVLFSIDMDENKINGLLGFYISKTNLKTGAAYDVQSTKHFPKSAKSADGRYSTKYHPWQSFLWEDFYISEGGRYEYSFVPVYGQPDALDYGTPCIIEISIPSRTKGENEVYFNRGVAGSQAYAREFKNMRPDQMSDAMKKKALKWLSKGLKEALLNFISRAKNEDWQLRCCFYEFIYPEVLEALKIADSKGADVKIIYDARHEAAKNMDAITKAKLDTSILIPRTEDPKFLQHNKYMILLKDNEVVAVWTGSTNITEKAIFGHCNVGHIIKNKEIGNKYLKHWTGLAKDPQLKEARQNSIAIQPDVNSLEQGMMVFFSPRPKGDVLKLYSELINKSKQLVCGMFPFSFSKLIKAEITAETENLKYIIIDKKDKNTTLETNDLDNVIVYGGKLEGPLYDWAKEKSSGELFYSGTNYIHNKVILIDPLGEQPIVITGSANFSDNSVLRNDENTLVIKGNKEVTDHYFTEFARIFNHYSARQDIIKMKPKNDTTGYNPSELRINSTEWTLPFFKKTARKYKRRLMFSKMEV